MSFLILPRKRIVQPQTKAVLRPEFGVELCVLGTNKSTIDGVQPVSGSAGGIVVYPSGKNIQFNYASNHNLIFNLSDKTLTSFSIVIEYYLNNATNWAGFVEAFRQGDDRSILLRHQWGDTAYFLSNTTSGWVQTLADKQLKISNTQRIVAVWDGRKLNMTVDGIKMPTTSAGPLWRNPNRIVLGSESNASGYLANTSIEGGISLFAYAPNIAWTDTQAKELTQQPYQIFEPRNNIVYFDLGITPPVATNIKAWNGTAHVLAVSKVWNGSAFVAKPLKTWNGTAWVTA